MCTLKLAEEAACGGDQREAGTEADAPSHFLLLSTFPVAQNLMGGIMPNQQSPSGPSFLLLEPHNGNRGPPSSVTSPFSELFNPNSRTPTLSRIISLQY